LTNLTYGRAVAQRFDAGFPPRRPGFAYEQHMGFVVDKAALGQVFSVYFGFPCQSFHRFLHYHNHPGRTNRPLSGRSVEWTLIPPTTTQIKKKTLPMLHKTHLFWLPFLSFNISLGQLLEKRSRGRPSHRGEDYFKMDLMKEYYERDSGFNWFRIWHNGVIF
jgi:hypothetical protein